MKEVVVFTGVGCAPCATLKTKLAAEFIRFTEKPVMQNIEQAQALEIRSVPTTAVYEDGALLGVVRGAYLDQIKQLLA